MRQEGRCASVGHRELPVLADGSPAGPDVSISAWLAERSNNGVEFDAQVAANAEACARVHLIEFRGSSYRLRQSLAAREAGRIRRPVRSTRATVPAPA